MNPIPPETLLQQAKTLVIETGQLLKDYQKELTREKIRYKGKNDLVSNADLDAEKKLVEGLKDILPEAKFIAEEGSPEQQLEAGTPFWILDPLDGTTNFIHNFPEYSISIALIRDGAIEMGIVYHVVSDEMFSASSQEEGAFLNEEPIKVSGVDNLEESLLGTGFPSREFSMIDPYTDLMKKLMVETHGLRRMGSAALDLAYVAAGRFDGFFEYGLSPWDVAAGGYLVQKAGGHVTDFTGGNNHLFGKEVIASNVPIYDSLSSTVRSFLKKE